MRDPVSLTEDLDNALVENDKLQKELDQAILEARDSDAEWQIALDEHIDATVEDYAHRDDRIPSDKKLEAQARVNHRAEWKRQHHAKYELDRVQSKLRSVSKTISGHQSLLKGMKDESFHPDHSGVQPQWSTGAPA